MLRYSSPRRNFLQIRQPYAASGLKLTLLPDIGTLPAVRIQLAMFCDAVNRQLFQWFESEVAFWSDYGQNFPTNEDFRLNFPFIFVYQNDSNLRLT